MRSLSLASAVRAAIVASLMTGGCVHIEPRPLAPEQIAENYVARNLEDAGLRSFLQANAPELATPWPRPSWDLPALTLAAFYFNADLEVAKAQWQTARASIRAAAMRPNPAITLTPGYNFDASGGISPWLPGMSIDVPVETAGKRRLRTDKVGHLAESARLNVISTAWHVRGTLRTALIDFTTAGRRTTLVRGQLTIQQRVVDLLTQRFTVGEVSTAELAPARIALTRLQIDSAETERRFAEATHALARSLGVPVQAVANLAFDFALDSTPAVDITQARRIALQSRADIAAGLADYAASETDLQAELAKQYPDLRLGPAYQWDQGESKWSLAVGFELPLNGNRGAIAEAKARRDESATRFRALETGVIADVGRATAAHAIAVSQRSRIRQLHEALEKELSRQQARLAAGDIDQLEYQNARLQAAVSSVALLDSESQSAQAAAALEDELQHPIAALDALDVQAGQE